MPRRGRPLSLCHASAARPPELVEVGAACEFAWDGAWWGGVKQMKGVSREVCCDQPPTVLMSFGFALRTVKTMTPWSC